MILSIIKGIAGSLDTVLQVSVQGFLRTEFYNNTLQQYLLLAGTLLLVILFNKYLSSLVSRLLFQVLRWSRFGTYGKLFVEKTLRPLEFYLVLHTIYFGFNLMNTPDFMNNTFLNVTIQGYLIGFYKILFIINTAWIFSSVAGFIISVMNEKALLTPDPTDDQVVSFLKDLFSVIIWVTSIICILAIVFHVNVTSIVAGAGIAGLAIAFAAQETLQNIFGSISIFSEKPFIVGDIIEVDGVIGKVDKVGFRSTRVRALDKSYLTIPNKNIVNNRINNITKRTSRRVQFLLGVEYSTPPETIDKIVAECRTYLEEKTSKIDVPIVQFFGFGASSLDIWVDYYLEDPDWAIYLQQRHEIMMGIMKIVTGNGASFAFPSQTLYMRQDEGKSPGPENRN